MSDLTQTRGGWVSIVAPYALPALVLAYEFVAILVLNDGQFCYTLDDAYTSLALSEYLPLFHYGVNAGEFSSPCSSILWPFLLAPAAGASLHVFVPLILNCVFMLLTVRVFLLVLDRAGLLIGSGQRLWRCGLAAIFVVGLNLASLVFIGMEHALQVLLSVTIALGLISCIEDGRLPRTCIAAIILSPLVRYEGLAISFAAAAAVFFLGRRGLAIGLTIASVIPIAAFSLFLLGLGLDVLPNSVAAKSVLALAATGTESSHSTLTGLLDSIKAIIQIKEATMIAVGGLLMVGLLLYDHRRTDAPLLVYGSLMVIAHVLAGSYGSFFRYEIYLIATTVVILTYACRSGLHRFFTCMPPIRGLLLLLAFTVVVFGNYVHSTLYTPVGANNIYQQQFQMRRFVVDHYGGPVAVNDLGLVSFRNPNYVLDLWGLGSSEALAARMTNDPAWAKEMVDRRDVDLVIIYDFLFRGRIPDSWTKVGTLGLGRRKISPFGSMVSFYVADETKVDDVRARLAEFQSSVPGQGLLQIVR